MAQGVMALFQVVVWGVISVFLFSLQSSFLTQNIPFLASIIIPTQSLPVMVIYFLLGFFLFAAAFGAVGALSNSSQEGSQYTIVFVIPAMIPYFLMSQLVSDPNGPLAVILSIFPITAPITMIARSTMVAVPLWQVVVSVVVLGVTVLGAFWLAGRLFRAQLEIDSERRQFALNGGDGVARGISAWDVFF